MLCCLRNLWSTNWKFCNSHNKKAYTSLYFGKFQNLIDKYLHKMFIYKIVEFTVDETSRFEASFDSGFKTFRMNFLLWSTSNLIRAKPLSWFHFGWLGRTLKCNATLSPITSNRHPHCARDEKADSFSPHVPLMSKPAVNDEDNIPINFN